MTNVKLLAVIVLMIFFGPLVTSLSYVVPFEIECIERQIPSDVEAIELLPYPTFSGAPNITDLGLSNQFSWNHLGGNNNNHVNLTWNHIANTELDFEDTFSSTYEYPDCREFIYLSQSFNWSFNNMPIDESLRVEYNIDTTGNFSRTGDGALMFKVYVWIIDSSNNWIRVHYSTRPYEDGFVFIPITLNALQRVELWEGMIKDENGNQEDPEDRVTIAIGLAPTRQFLEYGSIEPWREYSGSVTLQVRIMSFEVLITQETDTSKFLPVMYNNTWTEFNFTSLQGLAVSQDGYVYCIGSISSLQDDLTKHSMLLAKWDSQANMLWSKVWNGTGTARGNDVATHENYLYTIGGVSSEIGTQRGDLDFILIKWDSSGNQIWNATGDIDMAFQVDVVPDGSIYVLGGIQEFYQINNSFYNPSLLKYNSNGELLWSKTWHTYHFPEDYWRLETTTDGCIYTFDGENITRWDAFGNALWNYPSMWGNFESASANCWYSSTPNYRELYTSIDIMKYNFTKYENGLDPLVWNDSISITYGQWQSTLDSRPISLGLDNTIYFIIFKITDFTLGMADNYIFVKYNSTGTLLWNRTLEISQNDWILYMESTNDGIIYCAGRDEQGRIILRIYHDPDRNVPLIPESIALVLYATASILIILVVADYIRRKRRSN